jgi:hypothetical protein
VERLALFSLRPQTDEGVRTSGIPMRQTMRQTPRDRGKTMTIANRTVKESLTASRELVEANLLELRTFPH